MWMPIFSSYISIINYLIFLSFVGLTLYNFFSAIFIGPGHVLSKWTPDNPSISEKLQYCSICQSYKWPRAHHCRTCNKCNLKMDHHCPWINNCVGHKNHLNFTLFLLFAVLGALHSVILLSIAIYRGYHATWYFYHRGPESVVLLTFASFLCSVFSIGLSIGVIIAVGGLFYVQMKIILRNRTSIEEWIVTKAEARTRTEPFVYPYDLGYRKNFMLVFRDSKWMDGCNWPIKEGCTQYTLTYEQILQKKEKRQRSRTYKVIAEYNGSWFPLFSQGWRTCLKFPFSDEARISLNVNDVVTVTRWKKHWLYGEKIHPMNENIIKPRGWFPKQCVVEIAEDIRERRGMNFSEDHSAKSSRLRKIQ